MKFFQRGKGSKGAINGGVAGAQHLTSSRVPAASQLTGNRMESLNDIDTIYTSPQQHPPPPSQQQRQIPRQQSRPVAGRAHQHQPVVASPVVRAAQPAPSDLPPEMHRSKEEKDAAIEATRELVKRFISDIWNRGKVDLIPELCSSSLRFNNEDNTGFDRVGHEGLAGMVRMIRESLDDYHCEIHSMVVEENKAFCRFRFTGKHTGELLGFAATNKMVSWIGATEFTVHNGKILTVWELADLNRLEGLLAGEEEP